MQTAKYILLLLFLATILAFVVNRISVKFKFDPGAQVYEGYVYEQPILDGRFKKLAIADKRINLSRYEPVNQGDYILLDFSTCLYNEQYNNYSHCEVKVHPYEKHWLFADIYKIRQSIVQNVKKSLPSPHDSLVLAMTIGYEDDLPDSLTEKLKEIGAIHMLVVSGYNVSLILNSSGVLLLRLGKTNYLIFSLLILVLFLFITGFQAPIMRAVIMGTFVVLSRVLERVGSALYFLILSALLMVAWDFSNLSNISFQLSFAATFGVIIFSEIFSFKNNLLSGFFASIGATAFVFPIISFHFKVVNLLGILSSLVLGWLIPYITYLGVLSFTVNNIMVKALLTIIINLFMGLSTLIERFAFVNFSYQISPITVVLYYIFMGMFLYSIYRVKEINKYE